MYRFQKFPFILVFVIREDRVSFVAMAHTRRKPGYWRERLDAEASIREIPSPRNAEGEGQVSSHTAPRHSQDPRRRRSYFKPGMKKQSAATMPKITCETDGNTAIAAAASISAIAWK